MLLHALRAAMMGTSRWTVPVSPEQAGTGCFLDARRERRAYNSLIFVPTLVDFQSTNFLTSIGFSCWTTLRWFVEYCQTPLGRHCLVSREVHTMFCPQECSQVELSAQIVIITIFLLGNSLSFLFFRRELHHQCQCHCVQVRRCLLDFITVFFVQLITVVPTVLHGAFSAFLHSGFLAVNHGASPGIHHGDCRAAHHGFFSRCSSSRSFSWN